jgi:hypothetical protein
MSCQYKNNPISPRNNQKNLVLVDIFDLKLLPKYRARLGLVILLSHTTTSLIKSY